MLTARTVGSFWVTLLVAIPLVSCGNPADVNHSHLRMAGSTPVTVIIGNGAAGMGPLAFGTNPLVIPQGTLVIWQNNDTVPHTATSDTGVWDTGTIQPGASANFTFNDVGTFSYSSTPDGAASMSGVIEVTPGPSPSPSPSVTPSTTPSAMPTTKPTKPSQQQQQQQQPITTPSTSPTGW